MNSNSAVSATLLTMSCLLLVSCGSDSTPPAQGEQGKSSQPASGHARSDSVALPSDTESMVIIETAAASAEAVEPSPNKAADGALAKTGAQAGDKGTASPPPAFAVCAACHSVDAGGGHGIGPNLFGIVGARAGTRANFQYSDAMKNSKVTWNQGQLSAFIASPETVVPGNVMPFPGEKNASKRNEIVKYLASLK